VAGVASPGGGVNLQIATLDSSVHKTMGHAVLTRMRAEPNSLLRGSLLKLNQWFFLPMNWPPNGGQSPCSWDAQNQLNNFQLFNFVRWLLVALFVCSCSSLFHP
jgi:hypothetical protein